MSAYCLPEAFLRERNRTPRLVFPHEQEAIGIPCDVAYIAEWDGVLHPGAHPNAPPICATEGEEEDPA